MILFTAARVMILYSAILATIKFSAAQIITHSRVVTVKIYSYTYYTAKKIMPSRLNLMTALLP